MTAPSPTPGTSTKSPTELLSRLIGRDGFYYDTDVGRPLPSTIELPDSPPRPHWFSEDPDPAPCRTFVLHLARPDGTAVYHEL